MSDTGLSGSHRAGQAVAGRYALTRLIATGGMAEVWEARDELLARPVAVKVPLAHLRARPEFMERFRREAVAAARLNHPNVVAVYDTGSDPLVGGYIVMELISGLSLRQVMREQGLLGVNRSVDIAAQVAGALHYAHEHGVVHRDVKPANVLLSDSSVVKVVDFGIAKALLGDDLTQTDVTLGTARYLAPEQVEGRPPDARSDLYSLGIMLFEMLCGRAPFDADNELALALKHTTETPPAPSTMQESVPAWLDAVVLKALAKSPSDRFDTAADMRRALLGLDPEPVVAPPARAGAGPAGADPTTALRTSGPGDDATPVPDTTGALSAPAVPRGRRLHPLARAVILVALLALVGGGAAAAALLTGSGGNKGRGAATAPTTAPKAAPGPTATTIVGADAFDPPPGDGIEQNALLPNLYAGDPSKMWKTEIYTNPHFGNLKSGVGAAVELSSTASPHKMTFRTATTGWVFSVYESTSSSMPATLGDWGSPVVSDHVAGSSPVSVTLPGQQARWVLVWITDLGQGNSQVAFGDVRLT